MSHSIAKRLICTLTLLALGLLMANAAYAQASLGIGVQVTPTSESDANGHITYTATVSNAGPGAANNVVVTFTLPYTELPIDSTPSSCVFTYNGPLYATCHLGTIPSGGIATAAAVIYPTGVGNLFATVDVSESGGSTAEVQGGSTVTGVGIAGVLVQLTATPNPAKVGSTLKYSMLAYNIGDDDAQGVSISLVLPSTVTFVSATKGCIHSGSLVTCSVGHMIVSGSATFNVNVRPTASGWTYATAMLRAETVADPSTLDNSFASRIWVNP
jgi:uncharacterized repeat protein (TIGR01451 family)